MFYIERIPEPPILCQIKSYNHSMVLIYLKYMYNKCHICNQELSAGTTIEHVEPKEHNTELIKEWTNLVLCCNTCNSKKGDKKESVVNVTNSQYNGNEGPKLEDLITYSLNGTMNSSNKLIERTIELYDLNRISLKRKRSRKLHAAFKEKEVRYHNHMEFRGMFTSMRTILENKGITYIGEI